MKQSKRTAIRLRVLSDLQRVMEEGKKRIVIPVNVETDDPEKFFALEYLAEKKYVYFKQTSTDHYVAKITPNGKAYLDMHHALQVTPVSIAK